MTLRLFVALELPEAIHQALAGIQRQLRKAAGARADEVRWTAPEGMHLTLQFLGAVPEGQVDEVSAAVARTAAVGRPLSLRLGGVGGFPNARRPRVIWVGVDGEVALLAELARALGERLRPLGFPPEERAFKAHLTLGRARDRNAPGMAGAMAAASQADAGWSARELCLFRSHLSPKGATYQVIARAPLSS
jgi:2'-5' RNA ligase